MKNNYKIKKAIIAFIFPLLISCENTPKPLTGEKVSIFNQTSENETSNKQIILEKPYINKNWNTTGGNNKNNLGHIAGKKSFKKLYSKDIGIVNSTKQILYKPVANKTTIFTIDGKLKIMATDINTGKTIWANERLSNPELIKFGSLALSNNDLYAITNTSQLVKLNALNGEIIYSKYFNTTLKSGLQICGDKLYFINDNNELYIINTETGEKIYSHKTMEETSSFIKGSTPICFDDKVIATFSNGEVHMIMSDTATPIWLESAYKINSSNINNIPDIVANPITNEEIVIIKSYNNITKALTIDEGLKIWENENGGTTTPIISNETIFDINNNKTATATDITTGKTIWETKLETNVKDILFDPLLINNQLIIPVSNGNIIKLNPYNGKLIETEELTSKIDISPIIINDKLLILSNGDLEVFN